MTLSAMFKTIGNGVPYLFSYGIASTIKDYLEKGFQRINENGEFEKKCNPSMSYAIVSGEIESGNTISFDMHEWGMCDSYSAGGYSDQIVTGVKNQLFVI